MSDYALLTPYGGGARPASSRDALCAVRTSGMQGLLVNLPSRGWIYWFDPYITSPDLTAADRQAVYAAKRAAGDTHILIALSWAYREIDAPAGFDGTKDWARFLAIYDECLAAGFFVSLHQAGDGLSNPDFSYNDPVGDTYGQQWLMANQQTIRQQLGDARAALTVWCPGFDGTIPGWAGPENNWHRTNDWLVLARSVLGPSAVLAIYLSAGYWAWSGENDDYATPDGQNVDVVYYEGPVPFGPLTGPYPGPNSGSPWDQVWQISKRLLRSQYQRPSDQPADDDPGIIAGGFSTPRGPLYRIFLEISAYNWVRGQLSVATVEQQRAYLRGIGWEYVG